MKKIIVLSNMYPSEKHPTFGIFVKNQVEMLRAAEVDLEVIAIDEPGKGKVTTLMKYLSWFLRSFIYILKNRKEISLTHAHYAFPTGLISLIGKKMMRIPYVITVHGGDIDKMANKSAWIKKMTKNILNSAEKVIVVGEKLRANVTGQFGVPEERVELLSMGVNTAVFKERSKEESRKQLGLEQEENIILFVGNMIRAKGLVELVEAFGLLKKTHPKSALYLLGSQRDTSFIEELKTVIQDKKVSNVHFQAPLGQQDLALWMSASDVLALPSHHEGFGLVALEAMAAGTHVVGTDVGGLSYLLNEGTGTLVQPKDVNSLLEGLQKALNDDQNKINGVMVKDKVTSHSYENILQRLLLIYDAIGEK